MILAYGVVQPFYYLHVVPLRSLPCAVLIFFPIVSELKYGFKGYRNLRVLTIDWCLLMGDSYDSPNLLVSDLPASLVVLNLDGGRGDRCFANYPSSVSKNL